MIHRLVREARGTRQALPGHSERKSVFPDFIGDCGFRPAVDRFVDLSYSAALRFGNSTHGTAADALPDDVVVVNARQD
jgi:hypothetical protein